jgi:hypothetical protein
MKMIQRSLLAISTCALMSAVPLTAASMRGSWPPEFLSGNLAGVDSNRNLVVVQTPEGVPFDLYVTAKTVIKSGDQTIALKDLNRDMNRTVSVKFIPERRGDVAQSIRLNG